MTFVLDANILLRQAEPAHPQHAEAEAATLVLNRRGHTLVVVPQSLYEFWVVATRPVAVNGLGLTPAEAAVELDDILARFALLDDTPAVFPQWRRLVAAHAVRGKPAHDARLAAALLVHGVPALLTFNPADFARFPAVAAYTPAGVLAAPP